MKTHARLIIAALSLVLTHGAALGQSGPIIPTTSFTRGLLRVTNAASAQTYLGVSGSTNTITGSGTANLLTRWNGSNTLTSSLISDDGTNVIFNGASVTNLQGSNVVGAVTLASFVSGDLTNRVAFATNATLAEYVSGTLTNAISGNADTATLASYVSGKLTNSISGTADAATLASYVSGTLTNSITGNAATASDVTVVTLTNAVNTTGTVAANALTAIGTVTATNIVLQQAALTAASADTNFVVNFTTAANQLVTCTTNINFTHATNSAAGRGTVILLSNWSGADRLLSVPSTWRQRGIEATLTNETITVLSLYAYGADNTTNILASMSWFK